MKINPATGAIIWKTFVPASNVNPTSQGLTRIEAYHGTNDVIAMAFNLGLCRIDDTGMQQWYTAVGGSSVAPPTDNRRMFDVDASGRIICLNSAGTAMQQLNGSGSTVWTRASFIPSSIRSKSAYSLVGVASGISFVIKKIDNTTGMDSTTSATVFGIAPKIQAINTTDDSFLENENLGPRRRDNSLAIVSTPAWTPESTRFGANGYADAEASNNRARATDGAGTTLWALTGIAGATFSGSLLDCCSDASYSYESVGYYFSGTQMTGTSGLKFNIFKTDINGSLLWTQQYGASPASTTVSGLCLSDDGYLYAAGGYNPS